MKAIGIEGNWPEASPLTWGAVALLDEERHVLINSVTRQTGIIDASEQYFEFKTEVTISPGQTDCALIGVAVRRTAPGFKHLAVPIDTLVGVVACKRYSTYIVYIFQDRAAFDDYTSHAVPQVFAEYLASDSEQNDVFAHELAQTLMMLAPRNPYSNLLSVVTSENPDRALSAAKMMLRRSKSDTDLFMRLYEALSLETFVYEIRYEGGVTEGKGIGIGDAANILNNLVIVQERTRNTVVKADRFLEAYQDSLPSYRFTGLDPAASATFQLSISVANESKLFRLARYIEMVQLRELLRGRVPIELQNDQELLDALASIVEYDSETMCYHGIGKSYEPAERFNPGDIMSESPTRLTGTFLAFVQGIYRDASVVEARVSARYCLQANMEHDHISANDHIFTSGVPFLYRPLLATVSIEMGERRRRVELSSISMIGGEITMFPSCVGRTLFFLVPPGVCPMFAQIEEKVLTVAPGFSSKIHRGRRGADDWLHIFQSHVQEVELNLAGRQSLGEDLGIQWFDMASKPRVSPAMRIMKALEKNGGSASVAALRESISKFFDTKMHKSNIRRSVYHDLSTYLEYDEEDDVCRVSSLGKVWLYIFNQVRSYQDLVRGK